MSNYLYNLLPISKAKLEILIYITAFVLLFLPINAIASNKPIDISQHESDIPIGQHIDFYKESNQNFEINDIINLSPDAWTSLNQNIGNFGQTLQPVWLKLTIINSSHDAKQRMLSMENPIIKDYQIFVVQNNQITNKYNLGYTRQFATRAVDSRNFIIPVELQANSKITVFLRLETHQSMQFPLYLRDLENFNKHEASTSLIQGLYFGFMLALALYNIFLFASLKEKNYLYFAIYITAEFLYRLLQSGLAFQYFWPNNPVLNDYNVIFVVGLMMFGLSIFIYNFLRIDKSLPIMHNTLITLMGLSIAIPFLSFISLPLTVKAINLFSFATIMIGLIISIRRYLDGLKYVKFFMFGFIALLISLLLLVLNKIGILPRNIVTEHGTQIGDIVTALLMSLALSHRIKNEHHKLIQAEAESKAKSEFLATMSHEIRTPLNGVLGVTEILASTKMNSQQKHYVNIIEESGSLLKSIINDILDYSKIEAGKIEIEHIDFDLNQLSQECISSFDLIAKNKNIELVTTIDKGTPFYLNSDPTRIKQIIINLLSNAFKFTSKGKITLKISHFSRTENSHENIYLKVEVIDTGIGIAKDKQENLFTEFSQLDNSTSRKYGGTGLGLVICKKLSELLGGEIGIESEKGKGSNFWFTSKVLKASKSDNDVVKQSLIKNVSKLSGKSVVIAEDNPTNQLVIKKMLNTLGIDPIIVDNGQQAFDLVIQKHEELNFILMDCEMPDVDGYQATEMIRQWEAKQNISPIKIIALTAHALLEYRQKALDVGMNAHISKPVSLKTLSQVLVETITD
ncbi:MAG: ATP-binding protein [Gammaproteobacteria bacterium]|nr:ATP-binding protein [Gammaproteobacteria bacterium]